MNEKLDKLLLKSNTGINEAVKSLYAFQQGRNNPIKTEYEFLNDICLGGLLPNLIISILGRPGHGKSYIANQIRQNILSDKEQDIGVLFYNWEMPWFSLLLVQLRKKLKKSFKDILNNAPSDEEITQMSEVANEFRDERLTTIEKTLTPQEFDYVTRKYIEENKHRKQLFIIVDHLGIVKGKNKLEAMFELMEVMNEIKLDYPNKITFIVLGQLNREIEKLWRTRDVNPINLRVTSEYIYGSDAIQQYSDIIVSAMIPSRAGLEKYCTVNRERYPHLEEHIVDEERGSVADYMRLKGMNRVYYDVLKMRLNDDTPTLYCQILNQEEEELSSAFNSHEKDYKEEEDEVIF